MLLLLHRNGICMSALAMRHSTLCLGAFVWRRFPFIYMYVCWMYANIEPDERCVYLILSHSVRWYRSLKMFQRWNAKFTWSDCSAVSVLFHHLYHVHYLHLQIPMQFVCEHFTSRKIEEKVSYRTDLQSTCIRINFSLVLFTCLLGSRSVFFFWGITVKSEILETFMHIFYRHCYLYFVGIKIAKCLHILQIVEIFISFAWHAVRLVCDLFFAWEKFNFSAKLFKWSRVA